jgi:hypothetical protein
MVDASRQRRVDASRHRRQAQSSSSPFSGYGAYCETQISSNSPRHRSIVTQPCHFLRCVRCTEVAGELTSGCRGCCGRLSLIFAKSNRPVRVATLGQLGDATANPPREVAVGRSKWKRPCSCRCMWTSAAICPCCSPSVPTRWARMEVRGMRRVYRGHSRHSASPPACMHSLETRVSSLSLHPSAAHTIPAVCDL